MNPAIVQVAIPAAVSLATQALQIYFELMRMAGRTAEEIESNYQAQRSAFAANNPATLPDAEV